ncbi:diacylglycerol/lipid kinase family protein [Sphingomonas sp. MMS24-JH45]
MLGVLPLGTANSFCRTLGIPMDIDGAFEVLRTGAPRRIDLGRIDGDYFANCAAIGAQPADRRDGAAQSEEGARGVWAISAGRATSSRASSPSS